MTRTLITALFATLFGQTAWASDEGHFVIGAAGLSSSSIYTGASNTTKAVPDINYTKGSFAVGFREGVSYQISPSNESSIKLNLVPRFKPFDGDDSTSLANMSRKNTIDIGIKGRFEKKDLGSLKIEIFKELTDKHEGSLIDVSFGKFLMNDILPVSAALGSKWYSSERSKYYFGVYDSEGTADRAAYSPGAVLMPYLSVSTFYKLSESLRAFGSVSIELLPSKVKESPIVRGSNKFSFIVGLSHTF
jgi:outer membrane protein